MPTLLSTTLTVLAGTVAPAGVAASANAPSGQAPETYSVLQLNLCLSGLAGRYPGTEYPLVVEEAVAKITAKGPDAMPVNEACSGDIARIAEETGYDYRPKTTVWPRNRQGKSPPTNVSADQGAFLWS